MSQQIHAFIEDETYLMLKAQKVNISELVRNALRAAVNVDLPEEESELMDQLEKDKEAMSEVSKRISENSMKLAVLQSKREKEEKEFRAIQKDATKTAIQGGIANDF